jgi:hypothetical protein
MTLTVGAVAQTALYIGDVNTVPSPDTYVAIGNIATLGDIGTQFAKIAVESIDSGYTRQIKGTQSSPTFTLVMNRDDDDAGQLAVIAAAAVRNSLYNFKAVENDGGIVRFKGRVFMSVRKYGGVNALKQISTDIEVEPDSISFTAGS